MIAYLLSIAILGSQFGGHLGDHINAISPGPGGIMNNNIDLNGFYLIDTTQTLDLRSSTDKFRFANTAGSTGFTLHISAANTMSLLDLAGTGNASLTLGGSVNTPTIRSTGTQLLFTNAAGDKGWTMDFANNNQLRVFGINGSDGGTIMANSALQITGPFYMTGAAGPTGAQLFLTNSSFSISNGAGTVGFTILTSTADTLVLMDLAGTGDANLTLGGVATVGSLVTDTFTMDSHVPVGSASLGPTAPSWDENGSSAGLGFDADAETVHVSWEIPDCWLGTDNISLKIYWFNSTGDAVADGETVKWDIAYRSVVFGTETTSNGVEATGTVTYTQSGAGADGDTHVSVIALTYNHADQPLSAGEMVSVHFDRDVSTDTYSGKGIVQNFEFSYSATTFCTHN